MVRRMTRLDLRERLLAITLSGAAGFVDAVGFGQSGGFFVSFMSGNSTRLAVGIAERAEAALVAASLIGAFVGGVIVSTLAVRGRARRQSLVLALVATALAAAAALGAAGARMPVLWLAAFAMGAENAMFEDGGEVRVGLTYMTGTLVKMGQRIAAALTGVGGSEWIAYLLLWLGLVTGATLGALAQMRWGAGALWFAAATIGVLALTVGRITAPARN